MQCPNCNARLSCGCQRKVASDGKAVCSKCIGAYNAKIAAKKAAPKVFVPPAPKVEHEDPKILSVEYKPSTIR